MLATQHPHLRLHIQTSAPDLWLMRKLLSYLCVTGTLPDWELWDCTVGYCEYLLSKSMKLLSSGFGILLMLYLNPHLGLFLCGCWASGAAVCELRVPNRTLIPNRTIWLIMELPDTSGTAETLWVLCGMITNLTYCTRTWLIQISKFAPMDSFLYKSEFSVYERPLKCLKFYSEFPLMKDHLYV